jgi:polysaccharide export outer membrane protein
MLRSVFVLALASLLSACAVLGDFDTNAGAADAASYRLDSGDKLRVSVFGQADLSGEYNIDSSGLVALPLIEPVPARGLTTPEFAQRLESVLAQRLLRNPAVSIEVVEFRPFFILGEVNQPGQYSYVGGMSVRTAVAIAGGFTERASTSDVIITRQVDGVPREGYASIGSQIMPGDTVLVRERYF